MAAVKRFYQCSNCGATYRQWQGNCSSCEVWNSLVEKAAATPSGASTAGRGAGRKFQDLVRPVPLAQLKPQAELRFSTGFAEFDRVLGGGLVSGAAILIGGNPGAGKSTLLLQTMANLARSKKVCYVSGEESVNQILLHAQRLGLAEQPVLLLAENNLEKIMAAVQESQPQVLVVDSIQTIYSETQASTMGGVGQVRECAVCLMEYAKRHNCVVLLVGHVTKEGTLAGPRVLEHIVDASLVLESTTDAKYRTLRAQKNRFGAVNEIGVFAMTDKGIKPVSNPSALFMSHNDEPLAGSATAIVHEGSRQLLVEIQALVDNYTVQQPRRVAVGLDSNRLALLLGVLSCHCGLSLASNNVFLNIVGGLRIEETGTDLPCILALISSSSKRTLPPKLAAFGEIGLTGEIRPAPYGVERIKTALRQGTEKIIIPHANDPKTLIKDPRILRAQHISTALELVFGPVEQPARAATTTAKTN